MQINSTQKGQQNFNGLFQGFLSGSKGLRKYPFEPARSCPYADRLALKTVRKIMLSPKNNSSLGITLKESANGKSLMFTLEPKTIKKFLPKLIQIFRGYFVNLKNKAFWRVLNNKKNQKIEYEISQKDLKKMKKYFGTSVLSSEKLSHMVEDSGIFKTTEKFKKVLLNQFKDSPKKQKWVNDYFAV